MKKTFTFAVLHFSVAFGVAYVLTGGLAEVRRQIVGMMPEH